MLRLIFAILLLLLSLLVVIKAPVHFLWLVSVAITSYPYWFMALSLLCGLLGFVAGRYRVVMLICSLVSLLFYALPVIAAYAKQRSVAANLLRVFPDTSVYAARMQPFSWNIMFTGMNISQVPAREIVYGQAGNQSLSFDFYPSYKKEPSPVVIVIHGGSWESGDSKQLPELNSFIASRGYHVAAINYRLAPAFQFPAPVEDTRSVIDFLTLHAKELQVDSSRFVLLGRSAGGQIALMAAYTLKNSNIRGVVGYYAPADMIWGGQVKVSKLLLNTGKIYKGYFGGVYSEVPAVFKQASACEYVNANSPATLLIHGTIDPLVSYEHSVRLSAKLTACQVKHYFLSLPFATHGCDYNINSPAGQLSTFVVEHFLHTVTQ